MKFINYFKTRKIRKDTAKIAKKRLQIIIAHQRSELKKNVQPKYIEQLQQDILKVVRKYIHISSKNIEIKLDNNDHCLVLELNVIMPDQINN